ncbi:MAG: hypothetical protein NZ583_00130 [Desulfobacterota bacterium]|nr:hypothetical protein [Thermodesulfobacteriota bacterium]
MERFIYVTDCEGPVTKNDNAYEVADHFIKNGGNLFTLLSAFDDYLGLFGGIKNYRYGSTLKYLFPFLKAAGIKDAHLREFSRNTLLVTPQVKETLAKIRQKMDVYMISTSYEHYIAEVTEYLKLEKDKVFSTKMSLDSYVMDRREKEIIETYKEKILELSPIKWDEQGNLMGDSFETVRILKEFFFDVIPTLPIFPFMESIVPVGGVEKKRVLDEIIRSLDIPYKNVVYVGDSITDSEPFEYLREKGGITLSFNGNRYAIDRAEYVVISEDARILSEIVEAYCSLGKEGLKNLKTKKGVIFTDEHGPDIVLLSEKMRRALRGEKIGALG